MTEHFDPVLQARITNDFSYHRPSEQVQQRLHYIRKAVLELGTIINHNCPNGRDKSLSLTALEDVSMRAIKACVMDEPTPEPLTTEDSP